jgi:ribonucleoside-diphosphate reductase alpha subunit
MSQDQTVLDQLPTTMNVIKRDGRQQPVSFDKIHDRIKPLCEGLTGVNSVIIAQKTVAGIYDQVKTSELDDLAADNAAAMCISNPNYSKLAARIAVSNIHKETDSSLECIYPYLNERTKQFIMDNLEALNNAIDWSKDYTYDYFGVKTLQKAYLLKDTNTGKIVERIQTMIMRVAVGIHVGNLEKCLETYKYMSEKYYTHATPTMFNAGTKFPQMASCFLLSMEDDSIEGIFNTLKKCALISKSAGGIGLSITNVRCKGATIESTNGHSNGLTPMLKTYDATARYVDQGGGRRKGSFAAYLEPWHPDVFDFLDLKKNTGKEEMRARDLFYALWIPDLFMKRVQDNSDWSLFCPKDCPDLVDSYGSAFDTLYMQYEQEGKAKKIVKAQKLWFAILTAQTETGVPYILFKDACNRKSNQNNLGTIRCSNLCTEIVEYTSPDEVAVCNLASIALPKFVENQQFDYEMLHKITKMVAYNLNQVIDESYYPIPEAKKSNFAHRPIGIGVQGLADVFILCNLPFESDGAKEMNKLIFETMYHAALEASCELSERDGPYSSFEGSMTHKGILQFDLWNVTPSDKWDWDKLRTRIKTRGLRNSLLMAPMPTASTAQILGNNECFEPYSSNLYTRRVLAGDFTLVNTHLIKTLEEYKLWNDDMRKKIMMSNGSIQNIDEIPEKIKELFKTSWEIKQKTVIDMAADRGAYICQSQSMNVFVSSPTPQVLSSMLFYGWNKGLKTGCYYLRTQPATDALKVTVCSRENKDCLACSA